jgi:TolB-like protein
VNEAIAILPFENLSEDPDQDVFTRGFVEDIATEFSRFPTIDVFYPRASAALLQAGASAGSAPVRCDREHPPGGSG